MPDYEESLGDQNTFDGGEQSSDRVDQSLGDEATFGGDSGSIDDAFDDDMEIVDLAARYTTEGILGKGGMGEVLLATDTRLNRKVAIKRILGSAARSKTAVNRFLTEAQSIAALNHPNIVQIYDYGRAKDGPFLIMEFVEGSSLLDKCREGAVPLEEAIDLTCQLCDGLSKAHAANIVHRDIKPANVLLTTDGVPKLTDFGLAKDEAADTGMTLAGAVIGTLDFMPPEQRKDAALTDARSDLWSLAATLYQMVTGEPPRVIDLDEVPSELRKCIAQALKSKKDDRYQTANELREVLKNCLAVPESVVVTADNLGAGECPSCHTRNDSSRKFCSECAKSLRATCLQCDHNIPVWDKVCGECGGKQADLLEQKTAEYQKQKKQAEEFRGQYLFSAAIRISTELSEVEDERFAEFRDWAYSYADEVASEQERTSNEAHQHFEEAKKHRVAFDYPASIQAMKSIQEPVRSAQMQGYLDQLVSDRDESQQLLVEIKEAITNRTLEGLLPKVERGLELRGDRQDLPRLKSQLLDRQKKLRRAKQIQALLSAGDYLRVLSFDPNNIKALEMKQVALEQALAGGNFQEALRIDESNAEGLALKRASDIRQTLARGDHQAVLKIAPGNEEALEMKKVSDVKQALANADYQAVLRIDPNNAKALAIKKSADVKQALASGDHEAALVVDSKNTEALAMKKAASLRQALTDGDYTAAFRIDPSAARDKILLRPILSNSIGMKLKLLPPGEFQMGQETTINKPHQVVLTTPFHIGVYQVTKEEYERVMGNNPSLSKSLRNPVEGITMADAKLFCWFLSEMHAEKSAGRVYALPTEAQWEYACRAGTTTNFFFGDDSTHLDKYAWYKRNSMGRLRNVGGKKPNAWGLFDMHGNVSEYAHEHKYTKQRVIDPAPSPSATTYARGGSWNSKEKVCFSAGRIVPLSKKRCGFRVAMYSVSPTAQKIDPFLESRIEAPHLTAGAHSSQKHPTLGLTKTTAAAFIAHGLQFLPGKFDSVWAKPNINPKKLQNAIAAYAEGVSLKDVLLLKDQTLLGNGKAGMLFTEDALHVNMGKGRYRFQYCDIETFEYFDKQFVLNSKVIAHYGIGTDEEDAVQLAVLLEHLCPNIKRSHGYQCVLKREHAEFYIASEEVTQDLRHFRKIEKEAAELFQEYLPAALDSLSGVERLRAGRVLGVLGVYFECDGNNEKAMQSYEKSVELCTDISTGFWLELAQLKSKLGDDALCKAIDLYDESREATTFSKFCKLLKMAIKECPSFPWAYNNLAWRLATSAVDDERDGTAAVEMATKACELCDSPSMTGTLAAAYAETGDFEQAIKLQQQAVELCPPWTIDDETAALEKYKLQEALRENF
ncbi:protein kinase [bacterium]|nr:protein kinase [bacterium]